MEDNYIQEAHLDGPSLVTTLMGDVQPGTIQRSSPFDRLPTELLLQIIYLSCKDFDKIHTPWALKELPWYVGRVCSKWRTLSRADWRLWGPISIRIRERDVYTMPLEDVVRLFEVLPPVASWHLCSEFCDIKPLATYLNRCEILDFRGDIDTYEVLWRSIPQDAFVNLRHISFQFNPSESAVEWDHKRKAASEALWASTAGQWAIAHKLETAEFRTDLFHPKGASTIISTIPLPWNQLKSIGVMLHESIEVNCLWVYLRQCRSLTRLTLDVLMGECAFPRLDIKSSIDLPDLRDVVIQGRAYLTLLPECIWRNLTSLDIGPSSTGRAQPNPHELQKILEFRWN